MNSNLMKITSQLYNTIQSNTFKKIIVVCFKNICFINIKNGEVLFWAPSGGKGYIILEYYYRWKNVIVIYYDDFGKRKFINLNKLNLTISENEIENFIFGINKILIYDI